ncbi:MAG: biotin--[acetyl-CoA-carboxylase] ligase [Myxococcota bacterium]
MASHNETTMPTLAGSQPDLPWQQQLAQARKNHWLGRHVRAYATCPSTQPLAWQWVEQGAAHGSVVVSTEQTAGCGRLQQRQWWTGLGGLAISIVLRPQHPSQVQSLGLLAAVGLLDALQKQGLAGKIKWPNDVLLPIPPLCNITPTIGHYGKWAGILPQSSWNGKQLQAVVLGIGMNVQRPRSLLPSMAQQAIFLSDLGINSSPQLFVKGVLHALQQVLEQSNTATGQQLIARQIKQHCLTLGQQLQMQSGKETLYGQAMDITPTGALLLRLPDGTQQEVHAGEASIVKSKTACLNATRRCHE